MNYRKVVATTLAVPGLSCWVVALLSWIHYRQSWGSTLGRIAQTFSASAAAQASSQRAGIVIWFLLGGLFGVPALIVAVYEVADVRKARYSTAPLRDWVGWPSRDW